MEYYENALKILFNFNVELETEKINVRNSLKRVLAKDILLQYNYPDTLRSAVDGYALKFSSDNGYDLIGTVAAGELHTFSLANGEAVFIMTGGIVPESADAVARVEDCECFGSHLIVNKKLNKNENINNIGEEAEKNTVVAEKGILIEKAVFPTLFYVLISKKSN